MAGHARKESIGARFSAAMDPEDDTDAFLLQTMDYCVTALGLDKDTLLKELANETQRHGPRPLYGFHGGSEAAGRRSIS